MSIEKELEARSGSNCELCGSTKDLKPFEIKPSRKGGADDHAVLCEICTEQIENPEKVDINHWRCLNDSMWSQEPAVQVLAWRMLTRLRDEGWTRDLLDMLYLEDDVLAWAKANGEGGDNEETVKHIDANGAVLQAGDAVVLIKDLNVKGAGFTAKRGTAVRNILLVHDNPEQIQGKVNGQQIVILTQYVKKN